MGWLQRLHGTLIGSNLERDFDDEMRFHLEQRTEEYMTHGMPPDDARREARRRLGNETLAREDARDADTLRWLADVGGDLRFTARTLRKDPGFAAVAVLTLALGIGLTTAIFSVLDAVVVRPLPFPHPEQLVVVWQQDRTDGSPFTVSPGNFLDWQRQTQVFDALAAAQQFQDTEFSLDSGPASDAIKGIRLSPDLFRVLGVAPTIGRPFTQADIDSGHSAVVILGHDLWVNRFASDPGVVGRVIRLNSQNLVIIGVMPAGFEVPLIRAQVYLPLAWTLDQRQERRISNYLVLGRLRDGLTLGKAAAALDSLARILEQQYPDTNKDAGVLIDPLRQVVLGDVRPTLVAIFAASVGVLLLACFNLATLLSARGITRQRELSIRAALGAGRFRLMRQMLTEGLLIAGIGGVAGLACAATAVRAFVGLFNETRYFSLPRRGEIALDWQVLAFVTAVCLLTGLFCSAAPALSATRMDIVENLRRPDGHRENRWRTVLMVSELAVSLALVIASLLLVRSYQGLRTEKPGFSSNGVLTAKLALPNDRYTTPVLRAAFFRQLLDDVRRLPGVRRAAAVQLLPLGGVASVWSISIPERPHENVPSPFHFIVSTDYFETMGIPLIAGRPFDEQDTAGRQRVAILSQAAALQYFPNQNPMGRSIRIEDREHAEWIVVGVVGDVRSQRLDRVPRPQVYIPMDQSPAGAMTAVVRGDIQDPLQLVGPLRAAVQRIDREQALADVKTMVQVVQDSSARWRVSTFLFLGFSAIALVLAVVGLYGLTSYNVAQRTREIAIRLALGDSGAGIIWLFLRSLVTIAWKGVALGLLLALALDRSLSTLLYGVTPVDPIAFASAAVTFVGVISLTGTAAAFKASQIEPMLALKAE